MVVHWVLRVAQAEFSELLAYRSFAEVEDFPGFSLAVSVLESSSFNSTVVAAVFFGEPSEESAFAYNACFQDFLVYGHLLQPFCFDCPRLSSIVGYMVEAPDYKTHMPLACSNRHNDRLTLFCTAQKPDYLADETGHVSVRTKRVCTA